MKDNLLLNAVSKTEKIILFNRLTKDFINFEGVFSDETSNFVNPPEPTSKDKIKIKFRAKKQNIDNVYFKSNELSLLMDLEKRDEVFDYFSITLEPTNSKINYYFQIQKDNNIYFYNKQGLAKTLNPIYNFGIIPDFKTPDWAKDAVMYQIYVDRFCNGDTSNDVKNYEYTYLGKVSKKIDDWNAPVEQSDICNFYGGDLQGVIDKMHYLKDLGINVIYFNPIFVSPSNHKYDAQDYDYVDPHYGVIINDCDTPLDPNQLINRYANMYLKRTTDKENLEASNKLMANLIKIAHSNGIKVILDGVFNHCGAFHKWLDKEGFYFKAGYPVGAYRSEDSVYNKFFKWYDKNWPNNDCYDGWWGYDNHPKLFFENSKELYDYILHIGAKWVSEPFNADGWRLDVAADLGHSQQFNLQFWKDFRDVVKAANPNAIILAEHYGDPNPWLSGDQWDTVMNYDAFMEPLTWFLTGMEKHSEEFKEDMLCNAMAFENSMRYFMARFNYPSLFCSMNQLSNHDHSRFLTRTNKTVGRLHTTSAHVADINTNMSVMLEAVTFQMTWPGAPTIYYGDEVGLTGWTDPDNRRPFPWNNQNQMLHSYHKEVIAIRKAYRALSIGSVEFIYSTYGIMCFGRWYKDECVVVVLNNNTTSTSLTLPVWKINIKPNSILTKLISTSGDMFFKSNEKFEVVDGQLNLSLPEHSSIILTNKL